MQNQISQNWKNELKLKAAKAATKLEKTNFVALQISSYKESLKNCKDDVDIKNLRHNLSFLAKNDKNQITALAIKYRDMVENSIAIANDYDNIVKRSTHPLRKAEETLDIFLI